MNRTRRKTKRAAAEPTRSQQVAADTAALLRARNPLIWVVTREEARVEQHLLEAAAAAGYVPCTWDVAQGACSYTGEKMQGVGSRDAGDMLATIEARAASGSERNVWIMRDLAIWLREMPGALPLRVLRNLVRALPGAPRERAQAVVVISASGDLPPELATSATVIEWPLPDRAEIGDILDSAIEVLPDEVRAEALPRRLRDAAIDSTVGLSGEEAAACYAKSLVQSRSIVPTVVAAEKKRVIARERVLEWHDPLPDGLASVGGLLNLKAWLASRAAAYSPAAREYGLPAPRGALLVGISGCLTGDTIIEVGRGTRSGHRPMTMEALYYKFNGRHEDGRKLGHYGSSRAWDLSQPTRSLSYLESDHYIGFNTIKAVIYSGVKQVFQLRTDHGRMIKATADHEFLTTRGYVRLEDLRRGDELLAYREGVLVDDNSTGRNRSQPIRRINNVGNHPHARRRSVNGLEYTSHPLHRLVIEAEMNDMTLEEFLWALEGDASQLRFLSRNLEVHHKDRDRGNNTRGNLETLTKAEHAQRHLEEDGHEMNRYRCCPRLQVVTSITRAGMSPTYDIQMEGPNHNFIANGLVVHNCGKSLTAKAIASTWGVPLLRLDLGALKSKFVGESEGNLRRALRTIEAIGRCVVWIDEVEKALQGATGGAADGGVSADALGAILSWMQEREGEAFVLATANEVDALPPEFLRKGRFDEVWWVDLPDDKERVAILEATIQAAGRAPLIPSLNLTRVAGKTEHFTGAEVAALIPDAMYAAFADDARSITTDDLIEAAQAVVPLATTAAEKIDRMRKWAEGRAPRLEQDRTARRGSAGPAHRHLIEVSPLSTTKGE